MLAWIKRRQRQLRRHQLLQLQRQRRPAALPVADQAQGEARDVGAEHPAAVDELLAEADESLVEVGDRAVDHRDAGVEVPVDHLVDHLAVVDDQGARVYQSAMSKLPFYTILRFCIFPTFQINNFQNIFCLVFSQSFERLNL